MSPSCSEISNDLFTGARAVQPVNHMSSTNSKLQSTTPIKLHGQNQDNDIFS